jgi:purine-binding chemotaxis protein CheW
MENAQHITEDTLEGRYLTFEFAGDRYGIDLMHITEIVGIQRITRLPEVPDFIKGVINLRGRIIPLLDMRLKFNKPTTEYDERTCVIIIEMQNLTAGFIVDKVADVITLGHDEISPPPADDERYRYIRGIATKEGQVTMILNSYELFKI